MALSKIKHVRAFVARGAGADYHDQGAGHWIDDHIATPMARYPEYRQSRQSFGINVLGTLELISWQTIKATAELHALPSPEIKDMQAA